MNYFLLTRDDVIARRDENYRTQVWHPTTSKWADYPADIAHEGRAISPEEAAEMGAEVSAASPQEETPDE
jgi:hypothetical protein